MKDLWQKLVKFFKQTELDKARRRHNAGMCHKQLLGYTCYGRHNFKECE